MDDEEKGVVEPLEVESSNSPELSFIEALLPTVHVTRTDKVITIIGFSITIICTLAFVIALITLNVQKSSVVRLFEIQETFGIFYVLFFFDTIACGFGIWACLVRTGIWPMIGACVTLVLSSLVNGLVPFLAFVNRSQNKEASHPQECKKSATSEECTTMKLMTYIFWGTYILIVMKVAVIVICRLRYPHVFNWAHAQEQARTDSGLILTKGQTTRDIQSQTIVPGIFGAPIDVYRLSLRGSVKEGTLNEGEVYQPSRHGSIMNPRRSTAASLRDRLRRSSKSASALSLLQSPTGSLTNSVSIEAQQEVSRKRSSSQF